MKHLNSLFIILTFSSSILLSQGSESWGKYYTRILYNKSQNNLLENGLSSETQAKAYKTNKGFLIDLKDSVILFHPSMLSSKINEQIVTYQIQEIEEFWFQKDNRLTKSQLWGSLIGAAVGATIGYSLGKDDTCNFVPFCGFQLGKDEAAGLGGIIGGLTGLSIGSIVGSMKVKVPIKGDIKSYQEQKKKLEKYKFKPG